MTSEGKRLLIWNSSKDKNWKRRIENVLLLFKTLENVISKPKGHKVFLHHQTLFSERNLKSPKSSCLWYFELFIPTITMFMVGLSGLFGKYLTAIYSTVFSSYNFSIFERKLLDRRKTKLPYPIVVFCWFFFLWAKIIIHFYFIFLHLSPPSHSLPSFYISFFLSVFSDSIVSDPTFKSMGHQFDTESGRKVNNIFFSETTDFLLFRLFYVFTFGTEDLRCHYVLNQ